MALFEPVAASAAPEMALTLPHLAVTMTAAALKICPSSRWFLSFPESTMMCFLGWGILGVWGNYGGIATPKHVESCCVTISQIFEK